MQSPVQFAVGNDGFTLVGVTRPLTVQIDVPVLNAGTHVLAYSIDDGTTWRTAYPIAYTGYEVSTIPSLGGFSAWFGPYLPGTKFRVTSSTAQTAMISARVSVIR